jgi:hypothetical protein
MIWNSKTPIIAGVDRFIQIEHYHRHLDIRIVDILGISHSQHIFAGTKYFIRSGGVNNSGFPHMERSSDHKLVLEV